MTRGAWVLLATMAITAAAALWQWHSVRTARSREAEGRALFEGTSGRQGGVPLQGRLAQQPTVLPPEATRCINCHSSGNAGNGQASRIAGSDPARVQGTELGGPLNAQRLARMQPRRGGPPSAYDAAALCRVLRDGIDPVSVLVDASMPRYQASDAQCEALWAWLSRPPP